MKALNKSTICNNGTGLSIQASEGHYCSPRNDEGPYTHVEVGFIERDGERITPPDSWAEFGTCGFPCDVYGEVPIELVWEFIKSNGGVKLV